MSGRDFIQNPGPTNIPDEVLEAFRRPAMDFVATEFLELVDGLWAELPQLFGGAEDIVVFTSVGHGSWEATLVNLLEEGDRFLIPTCGLFGQAWADMASRLGFDPITTPIDIRRAPDPALIHQILSQDVSHRIRGVFVAHTETSGSTLADLAAIRRAIDQAQHPALFVVDAIASFGADPLPMAQLGIDVVIAASQKALMMPPGLSFCALSGRAIEHSRGVSTKRSYWDWEARRDYSFVYRRFGGTPPEHHLYALRAALDLIEAEGGLAAVTDRHRRLAGAVHEAVTVWGTDGPWELNATEPTERAGGLTCVRSGDLDATALIRLCREQFNVSLGQGMMELDGAAFRIGHMGSMNVPMLLGALGGVEAAMDSLGYPHGPGVSAAARVLGSPG